MNDRCQPTKKHHLVSRVILRQFCGPRTLLQALDIRSGRVKLLGPGGVCWIPNLRPADPNAFEVQWRHVEDQMPQAFAALERGDSLDEPLCDLLRRCLAVHLARSLTVWHLHQRALAAYKKTIEAMVLRKPENVQHLDRHFYSRHGVWPVGSGLRDMAVSEELEQLPRMLETMVPEGFAENYDRAVEMIKTDRVGVCVAQKGEFLIGDSPAQSLSSDKPGIGPLGGVTWSEATVIVMPISRRFAISTEPEGGYIDLDQHGVEVLNKVQAASAFRHIIWHPSADLLGLVQTIRYPAETT